MERADPNLSSGVISTVKVNCGYFIHLPLLIHNNAVHTRKEGLRKLPPVYVCRLGYVCMPPMDKMPENGLNDYKGGFEGF